MNTVEIRLLKYSFKFRPLTWRDEFNIQYDPKKDRLRTYLSHALTEVSGLVVNSVAEATKVLDAMPQTVINRVFVLYKGSLPESRLFSTVGLYKAPQPTKFVKKFEEVEQQRERVMDRVEAEMEQKFGRKELEETREIERQMAKNSKLRGATRATPDQLSPQEKP